MATFADCNPAWIRWIAPVYFKIIIFYVPCKADSPNIRMFELFCVTPFRTRGLHPLRRFTAIPAYFVISAIC